ncbi:hypothetical protein F5Y08DRAFT_294746 [Xylaria arbuscula]|nr:hypothetical protein F5Y08DRAFT_294746 [Xylaria arbuscula]
MSLLVQPCGARVQLAQDSPANAWIELIGIIPFFFCHWLRLTISCLAGALIHDWPAVPMAARADSRIADANWCRNSGMAMVMVVVVVVSVMLTDGNVLLVVVVLAFGFCAETHVLRLGAVKVPRDVCGFVRHMGG